MIHYTTPKYWESYKLLPIKIQKLANKNFELLKRNSHHSSLCLKSIKQYWSVRVGNHYRALGINTPNKKGIIWFWIGSHEKYNKLIKK